MESEKENLRSCKGEEVRENQISIPKIKSIPREVLLAPHTFIVYHLYSNEKAWCGDFGGHYFVAWRKSRKWILPPSPSGILGLDSSCTPRALGFCLKSSVAYQMNFDNLDI
ncbi:unnamed protein product [Prunus armeniaca]|uniref:Uncharacterized protein n=1 Tax=Prunus armeniaca TaxID=36596 RepID=A0A6J5W157_PRUAR|nr:unnamed protein product [Prunus armeniaca]